MTDNTNNMLRLFIERIERLKEEKKGTTDDIRDVYAEAKSQGFDPKLIREVEKLRAMTKDDRDNRDAVLQLYRDNVGIG